MADEEGVPVGPDAPSILPSQFTEIAFRMPRDDGFGFESFNFNGRRHMKRPYDSPARRILLVAARQVEKSTMLGNKAIILSCLVTGHKTLYVSPSATQTKTFSVDRVKEPLETSDVLRSFTTSALTQNVFEKQFINRSKITLRNAFLNADRTRGIPAWLLEIDELQDILPDNIPVIEQCTSHAPEGWRRFIYAGTPKSLDNVIEYYRAQLSTQGEWVVPCEGHGGEGGRYWNVLGERNIGKKGLICEKCGKRIRANHDDAQWASMVEDAPFESYRIPQLMVPWKPWDEILLDYERYPRDKFYNEVLGISYDSGLRPLSKGHVRECCSPELRMDPETLRAYASFAAGQPVFAGIDWGCHDEETRILTEQGFKFFRDLTDDDLVAQWEPANREMTFVKPKVRTVRDWDGPLLHFETRGGLDLMVTGTHRMRVTVAGREDWVTESARETAARGGNVSFVGHVRWAGQERPSFTLPGLPVSPGYGGAEQRTLPMDDWVELLGYLITEGGLCYSQGRPSCLKMSQRETVHPETARKIAGCMDRLNIPFSTFPNPKTGDINWTIYGKQLWQWYAEQVGTTPDSKRIPREFLALDRRQLRILFQALVDGDGYTDPRYGTAGAFYSTSRGLCEDFQELSIRLGLRCIVRLHKPAEGNHKARWRALWSEGRDFHLNTPAGAVRTVDYRGKVYCCAVPSGYIVTERNGCVGYQGNTGENTYTVLSLGTYTSTRFRIFYIHRFIGEEIEPPVQMQKIIEMLTFFHARVIGTDYGGGFDRNDTLMRKFGPQRVQKYQYLARAKRKVEWDKGLRRWKVHRTEVMSDIFNAIKRKQLEFPRWEEFAEPYGTDMTNIYSEYNESLRMIQYTHRPDRPDDAFHSVLYCLLASMIVLPRPDIIAPTREDPTRGPIRSSYSGPVDQG